MQPDRPRRIPIWGALVLLAALGAASLPTPGLAPRSPAGARVAAANEAEAEMTHPFALSVVRGGREGAADLDVRVNDLFRVGELVMCHLQSEPAIAAHGADVYVAFNDTRQCLDSIGPPGVPRSTSGFARSTDGGATFQDLGPVLPDPGGVEHLSGDPGLAVARDGTLYYSSLAGHVSATADLTYGGVAVGISRDGGESWEWVDASGQDMGRDKPWITVDNTGGPHDGNVYVTYSHTDTPRSIRFLRSEDAGATWESTILESGSWMQGSRPIVAPDGAVHVVWLHSDGHTALHHAVSEDGGRTFGAPQDIVLFNNLLSDGECPGYRSVNGRIRVYAMPSVAVDQFGSPDPDAPDHNPDLGRIYVTWMGAGPRSNDATDVWLVSRDPATGAWSARVRVNDDTTANDQLFPEVAVPEAGRALVWWADRRDDPSNLMLRQYAAESADGGRTFGPNQPASDVAFPPPHTFPSSDPLVAPCYAGDYNGLAATGDGTVYAVWSDQRDELLIGTPPGPRVIPDPNVYFRVLRAAS